MTHFRFSSPPLCRPCLSCIICVVVSRGVSGTDASESAAAAAKKKKRLQRKNALGQLLWGSYPISRSSSSSRRWRFALRGEDDQTKEDPSALLTGMTGGQQCLQQLRKKACVGAAGSTLYESFLGWWVGRDVCLLLRALVSVDARNKRVDVCDVCDV